MVMVAMIGFGSLARSQNIDLFSTLFSAAAIYGLPGQVAMLELYATGATVMAVIAGVAMANMRFFPMAIVLMPQLSSDDPLYRWRYLVIQVMSINSWTRKVRIFYRFRVYLFSGRACWCCYRLVCGFIFFKCSNSNIGFFKPRLFYLSVLL